MQVEGRGISAYPRTSVLGDVYGTPKGGCKEGRSLKHPLGSQGAFGTLPLGPPSLKDPMACALGMVTRLEVSFLVRAYTVQEGALSQATTDTGPKARELF